MENNKVWVVIEEYLHYEMSYKKIVGIFDNEDKAKYTLESLYKRSLMDEDVDTHSYDEVKHEVKIWSHYDEITELYYKEFTLNTDYTLN